MLESILTTLNAKEQESGVYIAESGCILPLLWEGSAPSDPLTLHRACWNYHVLQGLN